MGAEHLGLGFDIADEDDYDYYGYGERYYPRPPWTWSAGILGENFLRVFDQTWTPSAHV